MTTKKKLLLITIIFIITELIVMCISMSYAKIKTDGIAIGTNYIDTFSAPANNVLGALKIIGVICAVAIAMVMGIRYMMSAANEKADMKNKMIYYLIGAFFVAVAPQIIDLIYKFANEALPQ